MAKFIVTVEVSARDHEHVIEMLGNCMSRILYNHPQAKVGWSEAAIAKLARVTQFPDGVGQSPVRDKMQ